MASDTDRVLDVRDLDGEPFGPITAALADLDDGESLRLVSDFEPVPLYDVLESRGFEYETTQAASDVWHVTIEQA